MSFRKRTAILSPDAQADFSDILLYTWQQWGEEQRDRYEAILVRSIAALAEVPESGAPRPRLFPGRRVRLAGNHLLYYRLMDDMVEVVRILHERTDPTRHLKT